MKKNQKDKKITENKKIQEKTVIIWKYYEKSRKIKKNQENQGKSGKSEKIRKNSDKA